MGGGEATRGRTGGSGSARAVTELPGNVGSPVYRRIWLKRQPIRALAGLGFSF